MSGHWGYSEENGPKKWYEHYPIASTGTRQSPIDICSKQTKKCEALSSCKLTVDYLPEVNMEVSNTGHSIKAQIKNKSEIKGGPLKGTYRLEQFHLHWGSTEGQGSEHTIEGRAYDAELHLVHWDSTKYTSFAEAASKEDGLAVFGFLIKVGPQDNGFIDKKKIAEVIKNGSTTIEKFDPTCFFKGKDDLSKYYTYKGSLTTPPLYESVVWIVFERIMEISSDQMAALRLLKFKDNDCNMVDNYRPPVGTREVQCSF